MLDQSTFVGMQSRIRSLLRADLHAGDPEEREVALDRLGGLSGSVADLVPLLDDTDPEVRSSAAANLGRVREPTAIGPLVAAARRESDDDVLTCVMTALDAYQGDSVLGVLVNALAAGDRDYRVRMKAAYQLWKYDAAVVVPVLERVLRSNDHDLVRLHAAASLETVDAVTPTGVALRLWHSLLDDPSEAVAAIAATAVARERGAPRPLVEALREQLRDADPSARVTALEQLARLWPPVSPELIGPAVDDPDAAVRASACMALGELRSAEAIPRLLRAFATDPDERVVIAAALGLEGHWTCEIGSTLLAAVERSSQREIDAAVVVRQLWKYPSPATNVVVGRAEQRGTQAVRDAARSVASFIGRLNVAA